MVAGMSRGCTRAAAGYTTHIRCTSPRQDRGADCGNYLFPNCKTQKRVKHEVHEEVEVLLKSKTKSEMLPGSGSRSGRVIKLLRAAPAPVDPESRNARPRMRHVSRDRSPQRRPPHNDGCTALQRTPFSEALAAGFAALAIFRWTRPARPPSSGLSSLCA